MFYYTCGYNVAQFVICNSFIVNSALPSVSPCLALRAEQRSCGVVDTPATVYVAASKYNVMY